MKAHSTCQQPLNYSLYIQKPEIAGVGGKVHEHTRHVIKAIALGSQPLPVQLTARMRESPNRPLLSTREPKNAMKAPDSPLVVLKWSSIHWKACIIWLIPSCARVVTWRNLAPYLAPSLAALPGGSSGPGEPESSRESDLQAMRMVIKDDSGKLVDTPAVGGSK